MNRIHVFRYVVSLILLMVSTVVRPQFSNEQDFLPVDEAYPTAAHLTNDGRVSVSWVMPSGYYLYKHALNIVGKEGTELGTLDIPSGLQKTDEFFGEVEVYYDFLEISVPVVQQTNAEIVVDIHYQGCADAGLCYPPEVREFRFAEIGSDLGSVAGTTAGVAGVSVWVALGSALLAGVILNLMPCVFPILSIKALALVQSDTHSASLGHAMGYLTGVVATFLALALLLLALRAFGAAIGWGFQLQSPGFVAAMALLFFVLSMNLVGVIELPGFGVSMSEPNPFMTGVLAVIVATPCTVPFMAAAIGYAITQGGIELVAVMAMMGLGMALPYVIVTATPQIAKWLPRPGAWMSTFKKVMAIPLVLTVIWLIWVLTRQVGLIGASWTVGAMALLAFAAFVGRRKLKWLTTVWVCMLLVVAGTVYAVSLPSNDRTVARAETFEYAEFQALVASEQPIFLNVTADWCLTCLANERTTLAREHVQNEFVAQGVRYVSVDWTNRDAQVTKLLEQFGRYGVPMYVLFPSIGEPVVLPQVLTPDLVIEYLDTHVKGAK